MVSPSSSLLDFSDNDEGEHEYQDHLGDYSTRMGELFADGSEADEEHSPSQSPRSGGVETTKATYREQLRDVLGSEATGEDDEAYDLGHSLPHGHAFSNNEHPAQSTSDPQRPVSPSVHSGVHGDILNTLSTTDNPRRTRRSSVIRPAILGTIHNIFTRPLRLPPPFPPEYESPIPPSNIIPTTFFLRTCTLATEFRRYL